MKSLLSKNIIINSNNNTNDTNGKLQDLQVQEQVLSESTEKMQDTQAQIVPQDTQEL